MEVLKSASATRIRIFFIREIEHPPVFCYYYQWKNMEQYMAQ